MSIAAVSRTGQTPLIEAAYGLVRLLDLRWELSVGGRPIAWVEQCSTGWSVSGVFDRRAQQVFGTLQAAVDAGTLRY